MKVKQSTISLVLAFCMALAIGVQAKTKGNSAKAVSRITVTGCLQSGATPDTFVLNNATSDMTKNAPNKSANAPSEMARSEVSNYVLIPSGKVNLLNFVGKKVRVTGIPSEQLMNTPSSSANEPANEKSASSITGQNELKVSAIHTIPGTCP